MFLWPRLCPARSRSVGPTGRGCSRRTWVGGPALTPPHFRAQALSQDSSQHLPRETPETKIDPHFPVFMKFQNRRGQSERKQMAVGQSRGEGVGRGGPRVMGRLGESLGSGGQGEGRGGLGVGREPGGGWGRFCCTAVRTHQAVGFVVVNHTQQSWTRPALGAGTSSWDVTRGAAGVAVEREQTRA